MASSQKNLSSYTQKNLSAIGNYHFVILVSEWNEEVTEALYEGAYATLVKHGADRSRIEKAYVPGSFELPLAAKWMASREEVHAVICLGCVIQGETRHFDFINQAVAQGITQVGLETGKPIIFGVLTPDNQQQALDRAGGKHGNKGDEAAVAAIKMLGLKKA